MSVNGKIFLLIGCPLLLVALLSGCVTTPDGPPYTEESPGENPLGVSSNLRFNDVPVPSGFKILDNESFAFQNDATRIAVLKYSGRRPADQLVSFYKAQLPLYSWRPINIVEYGRRVLNYERDSESCIVTIEQAGWKSIITIAVAPKSRPMKTEIKKTNSP